MDLICYEKMHSEATMDRGVKYKVRKLFKITREKLFKEEYYCLYCGILDFDYDWLHIHIKNCYDEFGKVIKMFHCKHCAKIVERKKNNYALYGMSSFDQIEYTIENNFMFHFCSRRKVILWTKKTQSEIITKHGRSIHSNSQYLAKTPLERIEKDIDEVNVELLKQWQKLDNIGTSAELDIQQEKIKDLKQTLETLTTEKVKRKIKVEKLEKKRVYLIERISFIRGKKMKNGKEMKKLLAKLTKIDDELGPYRWSNKPIYME